MYQYEKYEFRMLSPLLGLMSLIFFIYAEYTGGIVSLALGVLLLYSYKGIVIDPQQGRFMRYDRITRFRLGSWQKLPDPDYVTIVRINLSSRRTVPSPVILPESGKSAKSFKVNLVIKDDRRYIPVCRGRLEPMKEEALKLGRTLGIRVLNFTTHEKHWIL